MAQRHLLRSASPGGHVSVLLRVDAAVSSGHQTSKSMTKVVSGRVEKYNTPFLSPFELFDMTEIVFLYQNIHPPMKILQKYLPTYSFVQKLGVFVFLPVICFHPN